MSGTPGPARRALLQLKRVTRVDLVDRGASYDPRSGEGAHVVLYKRAAPAPSDPIPEFTLPRAVVERICPSCATKMAKLHVGEVKIGPSTPPEVLKALRLDDPTVRQAVAQAVTVWKQQGDVTPLITWAQDIGYEACVQHLKHHLDAVENPYAVCHWLVGKRAPSRASAPVAKRIVRQGDQWCVTTEDGSETLGCHETEAEALAQLRAVEASQQAKAAAPRPWWRTLAKRFRVRKDEEIPMATPESPATTFEVAFLARTIDEVLACLGDAFGALWDTIEGAIRDDDVRDKVAAIQAAVDAFGGAVQREVAEWLSAVGGGGDEMSGQAQTGAITLDAATRQALAEPVRKYIEELEARLALAAPAAAADPLAGLPEPVRKRIEAQEAEIRKLRDDAERTVCIQKAAQFKGLPIKPEDDWQVFKALGQLPDPIAGRIVELLRAGDAAVQQAQLLEGLGRDGAGRGTAGDAWAQIEARARDLVAKSAGRLTEAQATQEVLATAEGKRLYREYLQQHPKQAGG
jgi:hypothetical protein